MLERGHQVTIVCDPSSNIYRVSKEMGIPTIGLPIRKRTIGAFFEIRSWLSKHSQEFDVINTHSSTDSWLLGVGNLMLGRPLPLVRTRHVSTQIHNNFGSRFLYCRLTDFMVTTGEKLRLQINSDNGIPLDLMKSVRTGIDLDRYHPDNKQQARTEMGLPEKNTVGILATLRSWKGHSYLLDAWSALLKKFPQWQLLIVGDGPQMDNLRKQSSTLGISDSVIFAGNQHNAEKWLQAMDVFTLPSYGNEGVPQGIMQAMATGLPVVTTNVGAIEEIVSEENGLIVTPKNTQELTIALQAIMEDESLRQKKGHCALESSKDFSLEKMLDQMENVFRKTIDRVKAHGNAE